jgi:uncharacterized protein (TIGR02598 family)
MINHGIFRGSAGRNGHFFGQAIGAQKRGGFSLVEVVLAIGVVAFAFVAIFALIPAGMSISRQAMETSVGSQIAQRVINDAQQTDFNELIKDAGGKAIIGANQTGRKAERYFDDQGSELLIAKKSEAIYHVNTRIAPATVLPQNGGAVGLENVHLVMITVQVANNPGNQVLALSTDSSNSLEKPMRNLWTGAYQLRPENTRAIRILTLPALAARNK